MSGSGNSRPRVAGFTLIELLVATAIGLGILGSAYACLRSGFATREVVDARRDLGARARGALRLLTRDLKHAVPLSQERPFVGLSRTIETLAMEADNLDFGSLNFQPRVVGEGNFCELSYFLDRSIEGEGFSLYRRRDTTPDDDRLDGGIREEVCAGVRAFRVEYYDGVTWENEWGSDPESATSAPSRGASAATNFDPLPSAVRITLVFADPLHATPHGSAARAPDPSSSRSHDTGQRPHDSEAGFDREAQNTAGDTDETPGDPATGEYAPDNGPEDSSEGNDLQSETRPPLVFSRVIYLELAPHFNRAEDNSSSPPLTASSPSQPEIGG